MSSCLKVQMFSKFLVALWICSVCTVALYDQFSVGVKVEYCMKEFVKVVQEFRFVKFELRFAPNLTWRGPPDAPPIFDFVLSLKFGEVLWRFEKFISEEPPSFERPLIIIIHSSSVRHHHLTHFRGVRDLGVLWRLRNNNNYNFDPGMGGLWWKTPRWAAEGRCSL